MQVYGQVEGISWKNRGIKLTVKKNKHYIHELLNYIRINKKYASYLDYILQVKKNHIL